MVIEIEGEKIHCESDFHAQIYKKLRLEYKYGFNLNALWDELTTNTPRPVKIVWRNYELSKQNLGPMFNDIIELFNDVVKFEKEMKGDGVPGFEYELLKV